MVMTEQQVRDIQNMVKDLVENIEYITQNLVFYYGNEV